jgi:succinate dehydrogenase/fumarate reductase flavoprotein subunit
MGVDAAALASVLAEYDEAASTAGAAGSAPPPPGGFDRTGKRFFPSRVLAGGGGPLYLSRVTPVTHYTMGGLAVTPDAAVVGRDGAPLPRLWAAGEAAGGLHGANRLGGNSLLETCVFGRIAGASAARATSRPQHQQALPASRTQPAVASVL